MRFYSKRSQSGRTSSARSTPPSLPGSTIDKSSLPNPLQTLSVPEYKSTSSDGDQELRASPIAIPPNSSPNIPSSPTNIPVSSSPVGVPSTPLDLPSSPPELADCSPNAAVRKSGVPLFSITVASLCRHVLDNSGRSPSITVDTSRPYCSRCHVSWDVAKRRYNMALLRYSRYPIDLPKSRSYSKSQAYHNLRRHRKQLVNEEAKRADFEAATMAAAGAVGSVKKVRFVEKVSVWGDDLKPSELRLRLRPESEYRTTQAFHRALKDRRVDPHYVGGNWAASSGSVTRDTSFWHNENFRWVDGNGDVIMESDEDDLAATEENDNAAIERAKMINAMQVTAARLYEEDREWTLKHNISFEAEVQQELEKEQEREFEEI